MAGAHRSYVAARSKSGSLGWVVLAVALLVVVSPFRASAATPVNPTTTTVTVTPTSTAPTGTLAYTITVAPAGGATGPVTGTGSWTLTGPGNTAIATGNWTGPTASISVTGFTGDYTLTADFAGDATWAPSSGQATGTFAKYPTATTVTVTPTSTAPTGTLAYTITVAPAGGATGPVTGTGSWTLTGPGNTAIATGNWTGPTASISVTGFTGDYTLTADFAGDATWAPSSGQATGTFAKYPTATTVTVTPTSTAPTGTLAYTITVAPAGGATGPVTGTGSWTLTGPGNTAIATGNWTGPTASISVTGFTGDYTLTADFAGDATWAPSSGQATGTFAKYPTATTVTVTPTSTAPTGTLAYTITVAPAGGATGPVTGTGSWTLTGPGNTAIATGNWTGPTASISVTGFTGDYTLTADFAGDATWAPSSGQATGTFLAPTTTTLTVTPPTTTVGEPVTLLASVSGAGTPTGIVTFWDGTTTLGSASLSGGQASLTTTSLAVGIHSLTATYAGDGTFDRSTSTAVTASITPAIPPTTSPALSPAANALGWNRGPVDVTLTAVPAPGGPAVAATYFAVDNPGCTPLALAACSTYSSPFQVIGDGVHVITYFSRGSAGPVEAAQSLAVRIDTTRPDLTVTAEPGPPRDGKPVVTGQGTAVFHDAAGHQVASASLQCFNTAGLQLVLGATDGGSGVSGLGYQVKGAGAVPATTVTSPTATVPVSATGLSVLTAAATDVAGNASTTVREDVIVLRTPRTPVSCTAVTAGPLPAHGWVMVIVTLRVEGEWMRVQRRLSW